MNRAVGGSPELWGAAVLYPAPIWAKAEAGGSDGAAACGPEGSREESWGCLEMWVVKQSSRRKSCGTTRGVRFC